MKKRIAIVEDNSSFALALQQRISEEPDMNCDYYISSGIEASKVLPIICPDLCILDIELNDISGIEVLKTVKAQCKKAVFLMCTIHEDNESLFQSLKAGANGYVHKSDTYDQIIEAIRCCLDGASPMSINIAKKVISFFYEDAQKQKNIEHLTEKENHILTLLSKGMLYKEIAINLAITIDTVKKHCGQIYKKLHVHNKIEAINVLNNYNNPNIDK